jgi:short-subunit dehydrogenase
MSTTSYKLSKTFPKKRAFITGAGGGLGRVLSLELAGNGWTIGISDISEAGLKETASLIEKAGGKAIVYKLDVADSDRYAAVAKEYLSVTGGIDLLINNAGVGDGGVFGEYAVENWKWIVGINQMGVIYGCHNFVPTMKQQKSGQIINIASAAGFAALPSMSPYNVTKAAVISLSETLYSELKGENVNVSVVCPTFFKTNVMQHSRGDEAQKKAGQKMVDKSGIEPIEIAQKVLSEAGKKTFYIVHPFSAKVLFSVKRLFPTMVIKVIGMGYKSMLQKQAAKAARK